MGCRGAVCGLDDNWQSDIETSRLVTLFSLARPHTRTQVERKVLYGDAQGAVEHALAKGLYVEALLLAQSLPGAEAGPRGAPGTPEPSPQSSISLYQHVVKEYCNVHLADRVASSTLFLHLSGQAKAAAAPRVSLSNPQQRTTRASQWRRSLAALLSAPTRPGGSSTRGAPVAAFHYDRSPHETIIALGRQLQQESMVAAAHACFLIGGLDPGLDPFFALLGAHCPQPERMTFRSAREAEALYRAEAWDFIRTNFGHNIGKGGGRSAGPSGAGTPLAGSSPGGGGGSQGPSASPPDIPTAILQPYRLRFALALAEAGESLRALHYALSVKDMVGPHAEWDPASSLAAVGKDRPAALARLWPPRFCTLVYEAVDRMEEAIGPDAKAARRPGSAAGQANVAGTKKPSTLLRGVLRTLGTGLTGMIHNQIFDDEDGANGGGANGGPVAAGGSGVGPPPAGNGAAAGAAAAAAVVGGSKLYAQTAARVAIRPGAVAASSSGGVPLPLNGGAARPYSSAPAAPPSVPSVPPVPAVPTPPPAAPGLPSAIPIKPPTPSHHHQQQQQQQPAVPMPPASSSSAASARAPPAMWNPSAMGAAKPPSPQHAREPSSSLASSTSSSLYASAHSAGGLSQLATSASGPVEEEPPSLLHSGGSTGGSGSGSFGTTPQQQPQQPPAKQPAWLNPNSAVAAEMREQQQQQQPAAGAAGARPPPSPSTPQSAPEPLAVSTSGGGGGLRASASAPALDSAASKQGAPAGSASAQSTPKNRRSGGGSGSVTPQSGSKGVGVVGRLAGLFGLKTAVTADLGEKLEAYFDKDKVCACCRVVWCGAHDAFLA